MKEFRVELKDVIKRYGDVTAVDNVSLQIEDGESVVLLGPSGCGKTTTLRLIAGLIHPDKGRILIEGKEVASKDTSVPPEKRGLSMVFQSYAVWPHKTVAQNIAYGLKLKGFGRNEIKENVAKSLKLVQMSQLADRYPSELSGGQQQRVSLARALVLEPKILLLDEPLSNLDATLREEMRFEIRELQKRLGITTIYVTHDQEEAMVIADRLVVMHAGCIQQIGSPEEIYKHSRTAFVCSFIGLTNIISAEVAGINHEERKVAMKSGLGQKEVMVNYLDWQEKDLKIGSALSFYIRPEDIGISRDKSDFNMGLENNALKGKVIYNTFLGAISDLRIQAGEVSLRIQTKNSVGIKKGEEVYVYLDPEKAFLLSEAACVY